MVTLLAQAKDLVGKIVWTSTFVVVLGHELLTNSQEVTTDLADKEVPKPATKRDDELEFNSPPSKVVKVVERTSAAANATPHSSPAQPQFTSTTLPATSAPTTTAESPQKLVSVAELDAVDHQTPVLDTSWSQPQAPRSPEANNLRQRKLSMLGYPNLTSSKVEEKEALQETKVQHLEQPAEKSPLVTAATVTTATAPTLKPVTSGKSKRRKNKKRKKNKQNA
jgi:hypothetical protein